MAYSKPIWAYDPVSWREPGQEPEIEEYGWPCNLTPPREGEMRWARHINWEEAAYGSRIWVVYQPELSMLNGVEDHPEEFELCEVVEVEICSVPDSQTYARSWALLKCLRSIPFQEIPKYFQQTRPENMPTTYTYSLPSLDLFRGESLLLLTEKISIEAHYSWILTNTRPRQIVLFESSLDYGRIQICNFPIQRKYLD